MKYIDSEKLITIIEERKAQQDQWIKRYHDPINQGISVELTKILDIITSLQQEQPEVDLEKEFAHEYAIYHLPTFIIASIVDGTEMSDFIYKTARHFYELGKNSK